MRKAGWLLPFMFPALGRIPMPPSVHSTFMVLALVVTFGWMFMTTKGFDRWWPLSCAALAMAGVAVIELNPGISRGLRLTLAAIAASLVIAMMVPAMIEFVKTQLWARREAKAMLADLHAMRDRQNAR